MTRLGTVGLSVAIARLFGPAGAGALGIALQVTGLGTMLAAFNLHQSLTKQLSESSDPSRQRALLTTSGWLVLAFGLVVGSALLALSGQLGARVYGDPLLEPVLFWCGPLVVVTACYQWVEGAFQGFRRFEVLARWGAFIAVLDLTLGVASAFWGVVAVIVTRTLVRAGAVVVSISRWIRPADSLIRRAPGLEPEAASRSPKTPEEGAPQTAAARTRYESVVGPLFGFAGPALLSGAIVVAAQAGLRLLLVRRAGLEAAGHFQAADSLAQGLLLIPAAAAAAFMPAVSREREAGYPGLAGSLQRGLEQLAGYNLGLCLAMVGVVPWVVVALFGREFGPARSTLVLLAAAYGLAGPALMFGAALLGRGEVWTGVLINSLWAAVVFGTFSFMAGTLGAAGLALAILSGYLVLIIVCIGLLAPRWSVSIRRILPSVAASAASLGIGCALALSPRVPAPVTALVCLGMGIAIFARWGLPRLAQARTPWSRGA